MDGCMDGIDSSQFDKRIESILHVESIRQSRP